MEITKALNKLKQVRKSRMQTVWIFRLDQNPSTILNPKYPPEYYEKYCFLIFSFLNKPTYIHCDAIRSEQFEN